MDLKLTNNLHHLSGGKKGQSGPGDVSETVNETSQWVWLSAGFTTAVVNTKQRERSEEGSGHRESHSCLQENQDPTSS